jgi:hypothetical protein
MSINLNDCKNGDKLRTRSGDLVTYDGRYGCPSSRWPHHILWGGKNFTVTNEGSVFTEKIEHPQDIVKILGPVDLSTCKPGDKLCLRNGEIATFLAEARPTTSYPYPYRVARENGPPDIYARNGKLWIGSPDSPRDVVEIITNPKEEIVSKPKLDPKNAPHGTIAVPEQEPNSCKGCLYESNPVCDDRPCLDTERTDEHNVIFVAHPDHESILRQAEAIRTLRNLAPMEVDTKEVPYIRMRLAKIDPVSDFAKTVLATYNQDLQAAAQKALDTLRAHYQAIADGKA